MAAKPKSKARPRAKKKEAASVEVIADGNHWIYVALDEDGKEVGRGGEGSRNKHYTRKLALAAYPDLPVVFG